MKNSVSFTSIIDSEKLISGVWDPFYYKHIKSANRLDKFVDINKTFSYKFPLKSFKYSPLEYKDIPKGDFLTYNLSPNNDSASINKYHAVPENTLLLGTMRAYLGNVIVTPKAEWLQERKMWYAVNSEFCEIIPNDNLKYFWLAFFKSPAFLNNIPTGTGGTRPRISVEHLNQIPILVPELEERIKINSKIEKLAQTFWTEQNQLNDFIKTHF